MPKIERNAACPCGSGKKYKRCCLEKDQQVEHAAFAERAAKRAAYEAKSKAKLERFRADVLANGDRSEEFRKWERLEIDYNNVFDLIAAGSMDNAEVVAADLLLRFPDLPEGHQCLGMVDEARGNHSQAANHYRQALAIVRAHPDDFDPEFEVTLQNLIDRLDPSIKT
ncbi:MAG: SEC-C metal-binding domain-containing protein [Steroidobacteraceae bacterium]